MRKKSIVEENSTFEIAAVAPWRLTSVIPLPNYVLEVKFVDGLHGFVEMKGLIMSDRAGVFASLKNVALFKKVYLSYGAVTWPGELDLAPEAMHSEIKQNGIWILN
ncbi:MAG: DUF2442 domain-containing protein [Parachlamydiaceae bacterium]|nr:DUF2442 domain-containing protein [Parachlamydiaceae bacterium]